MKEVASLKKKKRKIDDLMLETITSSETVNKTDALNV